MLLSLFYRPYIYKNNIFDYGFADVIGSLVSVIGFCTFVWYYQEYSDKAKNNHIILATIVYGILWEALGYFNLYGTFDKKDVVAVMISGIVTYFTKTYVENKYNYRNNKCLPD